MLGQPVHVAGLLLLLHHDLITLQLLLLRRGLPVDEVRRGLVR